MTYGPCYCENEACEVCPDTAHFCGANGTVRCMYIGQLCAPCAEYMPDEYLLADD